MFTALRLRDPLETRVNQESINELPHVYGKLFTMDFERIHSSPLDQNEEASCCTATPCRSNTCPRTPPNRLSVVAVATHCPAFVTVSEIRPSGAAFLKEKSNSWPVKWKLRLPVPDTCFACPSETIVPVNLMLGSLQETVATTPEVPCADGAAQPAKNVAAIRMSSKRMIFISVGCVMLANVRAEAVRARRAQGETKPQTRPCLQDAGSVIHRFAYFLIQASGSVPRSSPVFVRR